jgi:hypothetical protein
VQGKDTAGVAYKYRRSLTILDMDSAPGPSVECLPCGPQIPGSARLLRGRVDRGTLKALWTGPFDVVPVDRGW